LNGFHTLESVLDFLRVKEMRFFQLLAFAVDQSHRIGYNTLNKYYDLLRQLAAQIKKTYIHKITAGNDYKSNYSQTHAITQNYKHSAKLLHTGDLM